MIHRRNNQSLLKALFYIVLPPPPPGHPPRCDNPPGRLKIILCKKGGVKGMLPACCLPPIEKRGGYPHSCRRELPDNFEKEGFNRAEGGKKIYDTKRMLRALPGYFCSGFFRAGSPDRED